MTTPDDPTQSINSLDVIIAKYLQAVEAGDVPDREDWLRTHSGHADALRTFFADLDRMDRDASPLRIPGVRLAGAGDRGDGPLAIPASIRYFGDYELLEEIARGGMGVVYRARQNSLNRVVAIKMIIAGGLASEREIRRFRREAEAAANLGHPGIVPIYEIGVHRGQHYFSMGYVDGQSFAQRLNAGPLPGIAAAELLIRVAEAVQFAHEHGVLHRDLKPANVLLDARGNPRVTDFGLAKPLAGGSDLTATGQVVGTPSYMPPEQARGSGDLGPEADVYSLGAMLYAAVTGRPPFQAATTLETVRHVLEQEPIAPRALNPEIGRDLETICLKSLDKDPAKRYRSAGDFAEDLRRHLRSEPILARRAPAWERAIKWVWRRPAGAGLLALGMVAALSAVGLAVASRYNGLLERALRQVEQRELDSARYWYAADVDLAQRYWHYARLDRAIQILDRQRPGPGRHDLRSFEWAYLWRMCHQERFRARPMDGRPAGLVATGEGFLVAQEADTKRPSPTGGGRIAAIDGRDGKVRSVLRSSASLTSVALARGGTAWAGIDGEDVILGDARSDAVRVVRKAGGLRQLLALSPDGRTLIASSPGVAPGGRLIDTRSGEIRGTLPDDILATIAVFVDDRILAIGGPPRDGDGLVDAVTSGAVRLRLWDVEASTRKAELPTRLESLGALATTPDGLTLIAGGGMYLETGMIEVWDILRNGLMHELAGHVGEVECLAVSPDGTVLASGAGDRQVKLWQLGGGDRARATGPGRLKATYRGHSSPPLALAFSADGRLLASADDTGAVWSWDAGSDPERQRLGEHAYRIGQILYTPDGGRLIAADYTYVTVYDAATGRRLARFPAGHWIFATAISPDGRTLAVGGEAGAGGGAPALIRLFNPVDGRAIADLRPGDDTQSVGSLAFSPDGRTLAAGVNRPVIGGEATGPGRSARGGSIQLWDVADRRIRAEWPGGAGTVCFSPDGRILGASGGQDGLSLRDPVTGADVATFPATTPAIFTPDGRSLVARLASGDGIGVWDLASGQMILTFQCDGVPRAISPDGRTLATSENNDVVLYQLATGQELLTLQGLEYGAACAAFAPDGSALATGGGDRDENEGVVIWRSAQ